MNAQMILFNAEIITMTGTTTAFDAQAIAIGEGRILAVGTNQEILAQSESHTQLLDIKGKTVLPGFVDSHVHLMQTGLGSLGPNVYGLTSSEEVLSVVDDAIRRAQKGDSILVHGCDLGQLDQALTRDDLDRLALNNPVMIGDVGAHACVVNSAAWDMLHLPAMIPGVEQNASGVPIGVLTGQANTRARYRYYERAIDDTSRVAALHRGAEMALEVGITTIHALEGGSPDGRGWLPERDVEVLLQVQPELPVNTVIYFQSTRIQKALSWQLPRIGGCIWVDGSYAEHTAALLEPYSDDPATRGCLYFSDDELYDFVSNAHRAGLQISMHAIGDAAIEQLLTAYERVLHDDPRPDHRHRIEHFSLPTITQIERVAQAGIALGMQPNFAAMPAVDDDGDLQVSSKRFLGALRYKRRHPYRHIVDAGILVAGGSDSDPKPMGPLDGIHAVVNHPDTERRLTPYEALSLYTINGAKIAFEEARKGTIEPGKAADLVVLEENPLTIDPHRLKEIPIAMTLVDGVIAFSNETS